MQTPQRFISNLHSVVRSGTVTTDSVRPSSAIKPLTPTRTGNGRIRVTGPYTGAEAAQLEIDIVNNAGSTARVSTPIFTGVGNGTLDALTVSAANPSQEYIAQLVGLGVDTLAAELDFYGVRLRAKTPGAGGNSIFLSVDRSAITISDPIAYLDDSIDKNVQQWTGPAWDWGGLSLDSDGGIVPASPRIVIGSNYPVYRAYRGFEDGDWQFAISPAPVANIPEGVAVRSVSGAYTVTVSDGVTPEVYSNIKTLFDLLNTIRNQSALLEVDGVVVDDRTPGGMGSRELPLQTDAYTWPATVEGSDYVTHLDVDSIDSAAASQVLTLECIDNTTTGAERWSVASSALGALNEAVTGVLYPDGRSPAVFTIPRKLPPSGAPTVSGRIAITDRDFVSREDGEGYPDICLYRAQLGGAASPKTLRLRYTQRPPAECNCEDSNVDGAPNPLCLGISQVSGEAAMALDAEYQSRLNSLYSWRKTAARANTQISSARLRSAVNDLNLIDRVTAAFASPLAEGSYAVTASNTEWDARFSEMQTDLTTLLGSMASIPSEVTYDTYEPGNDYSDGAFIQPPPEGANGHYYEVERSAAVDAQPITAELINITVWPTDGSSIETFVNITWDATNDTWTGLPVVLRDKGPIETSVDVTYTESSGDAIRHDIENFVRRYEAAMDYVRALAGIVPKADAGAGETSACWSDPGDGFYWEIIGTDYLPAFNNTYYHSVVREDGRIKSTQEFGFALRVGCPERLKTGDEVTITINDVVTRKTYQPGDQIRLPVIAAADAFLSGGVDGDDTHTWRISGSVAGFIGNYAVIDGSETPFASGGLGFTIFRGGIPFELGDRWAWSGERGQFRWRYTGGAYSANTDIPVSGTVALADGLEAEFLSGKSPSFEPSDNYLFDVLQPYAPSNAKFPGDFGFQADTDANWTLSVDLGSAQNIDTVVLALHDLPVTATLELGLGTTAAALDETLPLNWNEGPIVELLDATKNYRYLRVSVTGAVSGRIGWLWAGMAAIPARAPSAMQIEDAPAYLIGAGLNPAGALAGDGFAVDLSYDQRLRHVDIALFRAMFDYSKNASDEPIVFLPNANYPDEALLARWPERLRRTDRFRYDPSNRANRIYSLDLRLEPYYQ